MAIAAHQPGKDNPAAKTLSTGNANSSTDNATCRNTAAPHSINFNFPWNGRRSFQHDGRDEAIGNYQFAARRRKSVFRESLSGKPRSCQNRVQPTSLP
mmetsp:Transcript_17082/g.39492  ORF Transcript_17082/g.39492 Transcript_17082/m.39492 type:complete len:98 (-) Transcript_17082:2090-2383(-)